MKSGIYKLKSLEELDKELIRKLRDFCKKRGIKYCAIYGSRTRGEAYEDSDLDIIVEFPEEISFLKLIRVSSELEELLGMRVDLITRDGLESVRTPQGKAFRREVERELRVIYEEGGEKVST